MNAKLAVLSIVVSLILGSSLALADLNSNSKDVIADKALYQRLLREIDSVDAEYSRAMRQAILETREDGKASLETQSNLLALSDKRDRIVNRVTLLSLRHGWDIPNADRLSANTAQIADARKRVFEPAEQMIKQKFAQDARRIAKIVNLPVVSIKSARQQEQAKKERQNKWLIF